MYAIIEASGTQIKVTPGAEVTIDVRDGAEPGKAITFDRVLVIGDGEKPARIGTPYVAGATVTAEVVEAFSDAKVVGHKFSRRKGYHRKYGHRQPYLRVKINAVNG